MTAEKIKDFRAALGTFATGVTIITTLAEDGEPIGVTASSFNSVSLDPPLVLWSLAKSSLSKDAFCSSDHFAIHVLSASQQDMSNNFAKSGADKFQDVRWQKGETGSPVIDQYAALFECKTMHQYEGGDHIILVGEVVHFDRRDEEPLVFHGGRYAEARLKTSDEVEQGIDLDQGKFTDDFLLYLIARAYFQSSQPTRTALEQLSLSQSQYMVLSVLSMNAPATAADITDRLAHTGFEADQAALEQMAARDLLVQTNGEFDLSDKGRSHLIETLSVAKAFEDDLTDHFTATEIADTKRVLKKLIDLTGQDVPDLFAANQPE